MSNTLLQAWNSNINYVNSTKKHNHKRFVIKEQKERITSSKNTENKINNFMKKTIFEQLVEQVMSDEELNVIGAEDTGAEDTGADMEGADMEGEDSGDITVTLTADQVECLRAILDQIDGGADMEDEFADEEVDVETEDDALEGETEEEEFDAFATEAIEAEEIGTPLVNQKKGNPCKPSAGCHKVQGRVSSMAKSGKANASVTDKVGNDGDEGTPLVNQKKGNPKKPSSGDNKVAGRASQVGSDLFA